MAADRNPNQTMHAGDGVLETHGDGHVLRFERRLRHPVRRMWSALTDPEQLAGWLAATELELVPRRDALAEYVHLDYLAEALDGHVQDWTNWSGEGWRADTPEAVYPNGSTR